MINLFLLKEAFDFLKDSNDVNNEILNNLDLNEDSDNEKDKSKFDGDESEESEDSDDSDEEEKKTNNRKNKKGKKVDNTDNQNEKKSKKKRISNFLQSNYEKLIFNSLHFYRKTNTRRAGGW